MAAGASVPVEVLPAPADALRSWRNASLVLVGGDCVASMARHGPVRRRDVAVVNAGLASLDVFRSAYELGATQVVELPATSNWLGDALAEANADVRLGATVGFISAAGGAGATSLAVGTACLGAERTGTVLVDLDPLGPGIERVIGYDEASVTTWESLGAHALNPPALREALPVHDGVHLVGFGSGSREIAPSAVTSVLTACAGAFDLTILDLPRSLDSATRLAVDRCDLVVVVCPLSLGAVVSGQRLLGRLRRHKDLVAVVRGGPRTIDAREVAATLQIPLLVEVSDQRGLDEVLGIGGGPLRSRGSGLRKASLAVLDQVSSVGHRIG